MAEQTMPATVVHNEAAQRFEATVGGQLAVADYERHGNTLYFTHTETPFAYRGQGIACQVVQTALVYAKTHALTVVPLCSFVANYLDDHPEYQSLLARE